MLSFVRYVGKSVLNTSKSLRDTFTLAFDIISKIFDKKTYNSSSIMVLVNQIYFTSIQILPLFLTVSAIIGFLLTGLFLNLLKELGLAEYMGRVIVGFVVTELSPFITVLLIALRSSSAMNAEIATMKVNKELHTLEVFHIDATNYLFLPRVLSGVVSVVLLSGIFSIVILTTGSICSKLIFGMSLDAYANLLLNSAKFSDIIILLIKCSTFGFFITLIPIRSGLNVTDELTSIPVAVLNGMVKVFIAIIVIEVLSLIARSI
ncbi:MAG: ABC transporter permease [Syntrophales bacterium LBB04]|nr:ABC transporter permease [Syntrophales bacterium LBB04]